MMEMKMKRFDFSLGVGIFIFSFSTGLSAEAAPSKFDWTEAVPWFLAVVAMIFGFIQYLKRLKDKKKEKKAELEAEQEFKKEEQSYAAKTAEGMYRAALKEELDHIDLLGSPDIDSKTVKLEDAFVTLRVSEDWRSERRFGPYPGNLQLPGHLEPLEPLEQLEPPEYPGALGHREDACGREDSRAERDLDPCQVMKRAFAHFRLLLVIGDPGAGKTTLLKYYAVRCLERKHGEFGFKEEVFPFYFPLRELEFGVGDGEPASLPESLAKWSQRKLLYISAGQFHEWLQKRKSLVLLDGLDEIGSKARRRQVCRWVKDMCTGLPKACFVVTSRSTGYRKLDGIEIEGGHLRADILDFTPQQQELFLTKWFRAVGCAELPPEGMPVTEWREKQLKRADQRSLAVIEFLNREENKAVRDLAAVPMLLQIMAIIWRERQHLPKTRPALYDAALNYLLEYRDRQKDIDPVLPAREARRVLAPTALWMQEKLKKDEAPKEKMHNFMQPVLDTLAEPAPAAKFCENLRDRAGLIADYDKDHYIFRHKSFREFLVALQFLKEAHREERIRALVEYFKEDWWEETLRFFMSEVDETVFDGFMRWFFQSPVSRELNAHQQNLLQYLVKEAPQRKTAALEEALKSDSLNDRQRRWVLDCLRIMGTPEALTALQTVDKAQWSKENRSYADDIAYEAASRQKPLIETRDIEAIEPQNLGTLSSFRNPFEDKVEYIKIPGGTYTYSVTGKKETVPDLYFCKYPVTNKLYRVFIRFLAGEELELGKRFPLKSFAGRLLDLAGEEKEPGGKISTHRLMDLAGEEKEPGKGLSLKDYTGRLLEYAGTLEGYSDYLGKKTAEWPGKFRSYYDKEKNYNGPDQPVVGVTWYAARAYCFWLSCLEAALKGEGPLPGAEILAGMYRLPTEIEWEWAAGGVGEPDGTSREYPWPKDKGEPNPNLANYNKNVGTTTPVGRYPEGATPQGLMDMAGNVWEWMENLYKEGENRRAFRGGSWGYDGGCLRCSARHYDPPVAYWFSGGFRVLRPQSL